MSIANQKSAMHLGVNPLTVMASILARENFPKYGNDELTRKKNVSFRSVLAISTGTH